MKQFIEFEEGKERVDGNSGHKYSAFVLGSIGRIEEGRKTKIEFLGAKDTEALTNEQFGMRVSYSIQNPLESLQFNFHNEIKEKRANGEISTLAELDTFLNENLGSVYEIIADQVVTDETSPLYEGTIEEIGE